MDESTSFVDCPIDEKLFDTVAGKNDRTLTDSDSQKLISECLVDNELPELLSMLCKIILKPDNNCHALYKTTIVLKCLCGRYPEKMSQLLTERSNVLKTLRNYRCVNDYRTNEGMNVAINAEQLLNFAKSQKEHENKDADIVISTVQNNLDIATKQLFQTLMSIDAINSESTLQRVRSEIDRFNEFLPGPITPEKYIGTDRTPQIDDAEYGKIVEKIVNIFDNDWPMSENNIDPTIEKLIIVDGASFPMFHETLTILEDRLKQSSNPKVNDTIVILLKKLIKSEAIFSSLTDICKLKTNELAMKIADTEMKWRKTIQILVSLPNRIANKFGGKIDDCFLPDNYGKILSLHICRTILFVNAIRRKFAIEPNVRTLSMLIGKAVIVLGVCRFDDLFEIMSEWCLKNFNDIRQCVNDILRHIDRPAVHPIAVNILHREKSLTSVRNFFGNLPNHETNWKHVFTVKIPLMSYHRDEKLLQNFIGLLSTLDDEKRILKDLLTKLLDIWGDRSAINHTSLEQHEYITKLIIMSVRETKNDLQPRERETAKKLVLSGTSAHLESTQIELRAMGMIAGEIVIENLNVTKDEPKLSYDYEKMPNEVRELVKKLRDLRTIDESPEITSKDENSLNGENLSFDDVGQRKIYELAVDCGVITATMCESIDVESFENLKHEKSIDETDSRVKVVERMVEKSENNDEDLDSDDDLIAYDMSNDTPSSESLRPRFLRDFKENLINARENTDPNIFEQSMIAGEQLITSQLPNDDVTFGIELLELLIALREISCVDDFELLKFKCCVAIAIVIPKQSAKYLSDEFHQKIGRYSIKDRLFMLDVLREAARRLSKIVVEPEIDEKPAKRERIKRKINKPISLAIDMDERKKYETLFDDDFEIVSEMTDDTNDWQDIVNKRIAANTRIFAHSSKSPIVTTNKFNDVASSFFYPLLHGFRQKDTCMWNTPAGFEDQENILLVNYLKTLSTIMIASENCVIVPKIAKEILELGWNLRYHKQAKVRLAVIENTASVVITLPKSGLTTQLMEQIFEMRAWLSDVSCDGVKGDPDSNCRDFGNNVVALIDSVFRSVIDES